MTECGCVPMEYGEGPDNTACRTHGQESERRERYENELVEHPVYDDNTLCAAVDAVMALADEESAQLTEAYVAARYEVGRSHREVGRLVAENARLRAELDRANQRLAIADEIQRERACLTPGYTDGPCHCVHCDPAALERDNARLRDELVEAEKSRDIQVIRLRAAQTTIERVRAILDLRERLDDPVSRYIAAELRAALDGGSDV